MSQSPANLIAPGTAAARLFPQIVALVGEATSTRSFLSESLPMLAAAANLATLTIARGRKGVWVTESTTTPPDKLPAEDLMLTALDDETFGTSGDWSVVPLGSPPLDGRVLLARGAIDETGLRAIAGTLDLALRWIRKFRSQQRRADRLKAVLDVTVNWRHTNRTDQLLEQIAETATLLLNAERATIFLIDPVRNILVGRPALGVEGGELLIPTGSGVVGRAMETRQPQRVDRDVASEQALVNRAIDRKLSFETHSLLCVPMSNSRGNVIGAFELINKKEGDFTDDDEQDLVELASHASLAIENSRHIETINQARRTVADQAASQVDWIGNSIGMEKIFHTISRVADTELAILITGENGTGKEVVAQKIHYLSGRRDQPLIAVNCAAITETLLESELFGHEKGAFTDAHQTRAGKFELASQGTLFLDEIGDMSLSGQAKLLRVLEEKVVVRVGGSTPIPTAARIIAATNQDLAALVREKKFREDLFFRLNVLAIELPPLRARGDDILLLAEHFLKLFSLKIRRKTPELLAAARKRLLAHDWPGNVRELRNMMERIVYLSTDEKIDVDDLPFINAPRASRDDALDDTLALTEATEKFQVDYINRHIRSAGGNMTVAAERLGLHRSNLYRKMRQLGMNFSEKD